MMGDGRADQKDVLEAADRLLDAVWDGKGEPDPRDIETVACFAAITIDGEQHHAARVLGSRGGKKGGLARAKALSPERRSEIARQAALARWRKRGGEDG